MAPARLTVPTRLLVVVWAGVASAGCTAGYSTEDLGDGCSRYRNTADVVTGSACREDGGCSSTYAPDGAFLRRLCPADAGCYAVTEADGHEFVEC